MIEQIANFAKSLHLNTWDWIAVAVAIFSLIVALFSLLIAWRTLISQRQTAKNTMPVITIGAQYESLVSIAFQIIDNYIDSLVLKIKAENMCEEDYLSDIFLSYNKINTADIHLELFYNANLLDSVFEENLQNGDIDDTFTEDTSAYRLIAEFRGHLERFNHDCQMLELQYINSTTHRKDIANNYAMYMMKESLELIMHTASITSLIYPKHNIGKSILTFLKKTGESSKERLSIEESKSDFSEYQKYKIRFMKLFDDKAWRELYETYYFYRLKILDYEELKTLVSMTSYCRFRYSKLKDYVLFRV